MRITGIREKVVSLLRPEGLGGHQSPVVAAGGGVENVDVVFFLVAVDVLDQLVQVHEPGMGRLILEVLAHSDQDVVGEVILSLLLYKINEILDPLLHVVIRDALPVYQRLVITWEVPTEARGRPVLVVENS